MYVNIIDIRVITNNYISHKVNRVILSLGVIELNNIPAQCSESEGRTLGLTI